MAGSSHASHAAQDMAPPAPKAAQPVASVYPDTLADLNTVLTAQCHQDLEKQSRKEKDKPRGLRNA